MPTSQPTISAAHRGFGIAYSRRWLCGSWPSYILRNLTKFDINFRELFSVYVAAVTFGHEWPGLRIIIHTDNLPIVHAWFKGTSPSPTIMTLIRNIIMTSSLNNYTLLFQHIPGVKNDLADALSRLDIARFKQLAPESDPQPTSISKNIWNWHKSPF